ncbi:Hydroxyacid oxidase, putative [Pediculus humanus corporis]|uniref:(S)-2-hydroxy-acid oxidase n=1 Tax=Pediculus humanus subsp. corporis TaxID=121224 RepID=E0VFS2_PEDHC|nr:Hydroxyacid oxidase, putative [Pediculus humanus corporis]EEB12228.1 Hydroxyacid oxidase, putative [Pediculus humanus corporis]
MNVRRLVSVKDYEDHAKTILPKYALDYYSSGAGEEISLRLNRSSFANYRIRPRFLRDVSKRDLSATVLGTKVSMPLGISPTAMQKMAHHLGEVASAKAAGKAGTIFILSTISTSSIEEVAEGAPETEKWFQLYIYKDRMSTVDLIRRAEKNNFKALVLTIDAPIFGIRHADSRNKFKLPPHLKMANFTGLKANSINQAKKGSGLNEYVNELFDQSLTWDHIKWLKSVTSLPIILKGILTSEDAEMAVSLGISAIFVSNHGARQVDLVPSPIEALPEISKVVNGQCDIYIDGGITKGTDIFIALALGAKMVFIGRSVLWGLTCDGESGVTNVLEILRNELDNTMCLTGKTKFTSPNSIPLWH